MIDNGPIYTGPQRKRMKDNRLKDIARKLREQQFGPRNYGGIAPPRAEGFKQKAPLPPTRNLYDAPDRKNIVVPDGTGPVGMNTYTGNSRAGQAFRTGWKDGQKVHVYADGSRVKVGPRRKKGGPKGYVNPSPYP